MYLANDVIQNSKKKGPEYGREFLRVLLKSFEHIGECCATDDKTLGSLSRILNIWEERGVYDAKTVREFRAAIQRTVGGGGTAAVASGVASAGGTPSADDDLNSNGSEPTEGAGVKRKTVAEQAVVGKRQKAAIGDKLETTAEVNGLESHVALKQQEPAGKWCDYHAGRL